MNKPEVQKLNYYDWSDCEEYLQKRYFDKAYDWDKTRIYMLEMNGAGNDSYVCHWPDAESGDATEEGDLGEMLEILTQEFGERDEDGQINTAPIKFWMSW
jgi:hypothetical protein